MSPGAADRADLVAVGRAIRLLRVERGLTRRVLAESSGLSYAFLSDIEAGRKGMSQSSLRRIATALHTTPAVVMAEADRVAGRSAAWGPVVAASTEAPEVPASGTPPPEAAAPPPARQARDRAAGGLGADAPPMWFGPPASTRAAWAASAATDAHAEPSEAAGAVIPEEAQAAWAPPGAGEQEARLQALAVTDLLEHARHLSASDLRLLTELAARLRRS